MIEDYFDKTIKVIKRHTSKDSAGGIVDVPNVIGEFSCRIESISSTESVYLARNSSEQFIRIYVERDADNYIDDLDIVSISTTNGVLVGEYEVRRDQTMQQTQSTHHLELDGRLQTNVVDSIPEISSPI